jgi:opacity protein-like surface antigen
MRKTCLVISIVVAMSFLTLTANAFDGMRKGFTLGGGIGPGFTTFTQEASSGYYSEKSDRENKLGLMTDFKIGYAPTDFWEIYYTSKVSWFGIENVLGDNVTIANGLGAIGATYYFKPAAPSPFIAGGIGLATWMAPFESGSETWIGFGLFVGAGYEFAPHFNVEADLIWGKPTDSDFGTDYSTNALTIKVTVNALAY